MTDAQQWQIIIGAVALATGGLSGAIFKAFWDARANQIQSVGRRIEILPILKPPTSEAGLETHIVVSKGAITQQFRNLFLINIDLVNRGNQHSREFVFGATLKGGDKAIYIEVEPPDRHHTYVSTSVSPDDPKSEIDLTLTPFNRQDLYRLKMYVVIPEANKEPNLPELSSSHPIKFIDIPTWKEMLAEKITAVDVVKLGPLGVTFYRR